MITTRMFGLYETYEILFYNYGLIKEIEMASTEGLLEYIKWVLRPGY